MVKFAVLECYQCATYCCFDFLFFWGGGGGCGGGHSLFEVTLNCTVSVCVSYCYRLGSPVVTERLPTVTFFWPVNIFIGRGSSRYEKLF
jgi:hypothetical protein